MSDEIPKNDKPVVVIPEYARWTEAEAVAYLKKYPMCMIDIGDGKGPRYGPKYTPEANREAIKKRYAEMKVDKSRPIDDDVEELNKDMLKKTEPEPEPQKVRKQRVKKTKLTEKLEVSEDIKPKVKRTRTKKAES